jgi:ribosome-binding factor A
VTAKRSVRVAERLREELSSQLRELRDPRLEGAIVSRVEVTDDLQLARVHVRRLVAQDPAAGVDAKEKKALLAGFEAASKRLRREVAERMGLRYAPNLRFHYDDAPDAVNRIEELLREVAGERGKG